MILTQTADGVLLSVRVLPESKDEGFSESDDDSILRVHVKAPARCGKANDFRKVFRECEIKSGYKSRNKVVLIKNTSTKEVLQKIKALY